MEEYDSQVSALRQASSEHSEDIMGGGFYRRYRKRRNPLSSDDPGHVRQYDSSKEEACKPTPSDIIIILRHLTTEEVWKVLWSNGVEREQLLSQSMLSPATCCLINPDGERTVERAFAAVSKIAGN